MDELTTAVEWNAIQIEDFELTWSPLAKACCIVFEERLGDEWEFDV